MSPRAKGARRGRSGGRASACSGDAATGMARIPEYKVCAVKEPA